MSLPERRHRILIASDMVITSLKRCSGGKSIKLRHLINLCGGSAVIVLLACRHPQIREQPRCSAIFELPATP